MKMSIQKSSGSNSHTNERYPLATGALCPSRYPKGQEKLEVNNPESATRHFCQPTHLRPPSTNNHNSIPTPNHHISARPKPEFSFCPLPPSTIITGHGLATFTRASDLLSTGRVGGRGKANQHFLEPYTTQVFRCCCSSKPQRTKRLPANAINRCRGVQRRREQLEDDSQKLCEFQCAVKIFVDQDLGVEIYRTGRKKFGHSHSLEDSDAIHTPVPLREMAATFAANGVPPTDITKLIKNHPQIVGCGGAHWSYQHTMQKSP